MCLVVSVHLAAADAGRIAEICEAIGVSVCPRNRAFSGRGSAGFHIPGPEGGCGCSFLSESADWSADTWDFLPDARSRLSQALCEIRERASSAFSFDALWMGEQHIEERHLSCEELVKIIDQNRIGTHVRYLVL